MSVIENIDRIKTEVISADLSIGESKLDSRTRRILLTIMDYAGKAARELGDIAESLDIVHGHILALRDCLTDGNIYQASVELGEIENILDRNADRLRETPYVRSQTKR